MTKLLVPGLLLLALVSRAPAQDLPEARMLPDSLAEITLSFAPVVERAAPAVVNIYTRKVVERRSALAADPFFQQFFGPALRGSRRSIENSLGSGVIVDPLGIIVSNHHVIEGADEITVVLKDRREFEGEVIFSDEESDLAVIRLDNAPALPFLQLRDSDTIEVGDLVLAIGNPFGVGQTVTSGIVSGLARAAKGGQDGGYFIQTDAAINPGNSGGALVDMAGRLVGVNTAILSRSGGSNGIGFAVPANLVERVIETARGGGRRLERPWLGYEGTAVTGELAASLDLSTPEGVLIEQLHPDGPLASAGLRPGDVILTLGGEAVNAPSEIDFRLATFGTGLRAAVEYVRHGSRSRVQIDLAAAPSTPPLDETKIRTGSLAGLIVVNVNPALIQRLGLPLLSDGVLIVQVRGSARFSGLRQGDIVLGVDGEDVASADEFADAVAGRRLGLLDVRRGERRGNIRYGR